MEIKRITFSDPDTFVPEALNDSFFVYKNSHDPVCNWMSDNNMLYEHYVLHFLKPLLQSSSIMVDIGSNVGCYSYYYRKHANRDGSLLCIGANSLNLELLRINCSLE